VFAERKDWLRFGLPRSAQEWRRLRSAVDRCKL